MKEIKSMVGWFSVIGMLLFCLFCAWDWVTINLQAQERRISALEASARPLFIVDKYSTVEIKGQEVYPGPEPMSTLAEEIRLAENENKSAGRRGQ